MGLTLKDLRHFCFEIMKKFYCIGDDNRLSVEMSGVENPFFCLKKENIFKRSIQMAYVTFELINV